MSDSSSPLKQVRLIRGLGFNEALSLVVGTVIGTGVFIKTAVMSQTVGSPIWVLAAWGVAGLLSFAGALCYAELGGMYPKAGGEYVFLREAYGDFWAFLFGWMRFWIGTPGSIAAYAVGAATFFEAVVHLGGPFEGSGGRGVLAALFILFFSGVNCFNVSVGGRVQSALTALKVCMIIGLVVMIFFGPGAGSWDHLLLKDGWAFRGMSSFGVAMLAALWAYDGWNNMPMAAGEVENPTRNVPLALAVGMAIVFFVYAISNVAYFYALPFFDISSANSPAHPDALPVATMAAQAMLGSAAVGALSAAFVISALGAMNGSILTGARIPYAMAKDGLFLESLQHIGAKSHSPAVAVVVQGLIAAVLALSGTFDELTNYVVFSAWIFYALGAGAIFVLRKSHPGARRPFLVPGYPVLPAIFIATALFLLINTLLTATRESAIGLAFIASGIPVFFWFEKAKQKHRDS
jgi:basic amino acid/polyamine antiporter, APA family